MGGIVHARITRCWAPHLLPGQKLLCPPKQDRPRDSSRLPDAINKHVPELGRCQSSAPVASWRSHSAAGGPGAFPMKASSGHGPGIPLSGCRGLLGGFLFQPHIGRKFLLFSSLNSKLSRAHSGRGIFRVQESPMALCGLLAEPGIPRRPLQMSPSTACAASPAVGARIGSAVGLCPPPGVSARPPGPARGHPEARAAQVRWAGQENQRPRAGCCPSPAAHLRACCHHVRRHSHEAGSLVTSKQPLQQRVFTFLFLLPCLRHRMETRPGSCARALPPSALPPPLSSPSLHR